MAHSDSVAALIHRLRGSGGGRLAQAQAARQLFFKAGCCVQCCAEMMAGRAPEALVAVFLHPNSLPAAKQWAARTLGALTGDRQSSRCQAIAAAGAVPALLQGLVSDCPAEVQTAAAEALADLTGGLEPEVSRAVWAAGGVQLLLPLLNSRQKELRHAVVVALRNVAVDSDECLATLAASALPALVGLLRDAAPAVQRNATHILAAIVEDLGYSEAIVQYGALPHLLRLLSHGSLQQQDAAALALRTLVCDGQAEAAAAAGAVGQLLRLLRRAGDTQAVSDAARTLTILTLDCPECCEELAAHAMPSLVSLLGSSSERTRSYATSTLDNVLFNEDAAGPAVDAGAVPALVQAMQQQDAAENVLQWAASSLSHLADVPGAASQLEAAGGVLLLVQLLCHSGALVQQMAAWAVANFSAQLGGQLVAAGAIRALLSALRRGTTEQDSDLQRAAASALEQLAAGSLRHSQLIVASGGIAALRPLLEDDEAQPAAAAALRRLAAADPSALEGVPEESESEAESSYYTDSEDWCSSCGGEQPGPGSGTLEAEAEAVQPPGPAAAAQALQHPPEERTCAVCGAARAAGVKLRLCAGCRTPGLYFCGAECQRQLWPSHRAECRGAAAAAARRLEQ